ncbi:hypothetical protein BTO20_19605 [Mycobacterium dioxanotrophicus]|uniref:Uncharacterized protein n=1 Tax=Mycobacterium dioxanotrophicus TaxID=482462 RepID=A0A1Y0C5K4_9MYCO|nr:hypothetical protein BTO20_19605 [Mycobacterium dioxanotrophicus]
MLHGAGVGWARLGPQHMHGTFILPGGELRSERVDYESVNAWISGVGGPDRDEHRPSTTQHK